jgi:SAM-dependent methyltransferase
MATALSPRSSRFNPADAERFARRIEDVLNSGALAVMLSIGHRTGLLDVLAAMPPSTSPQIAAQAGLAERYVREWLAVLVTSGVVDYAARDRLYSLPAEHAACLTRGAALGNLAVYAQHIALMGSVQERILECFESGDGMQYGEYPCFHEIMAEDSDQTVNSSLVEVILPLAAGLSERLTSGIDVLDAGCGRGLALIKMASRFPASRFIGYDLCEEAIDHAARAASAAGLGNVRFETRDLSRYDERHRFDCVTSFDAVHDQRDPQQLINSLHGALRPGGIYLMQDIGGSARLENNLDFPMAPLLYATSCVHCTPVSLGQGGAGLGTMWGWETAQRMLTEAGFASLERHVLPHDPMNVWFVARKS